MCGHMGRSRGTIREGCGVVRAGQVDGIAEYAKVCTGRAKLTELRSMRRCAQDGPS